MLTDSQIRLALVCPHNRKTIDQYQVLRTKLAFNVHSAEKNTLALAEFSEPSNNTMLNTQLQRQFTRTDNEKVSFFDHTFLSLLHVKPRCAPRLPNNLCFDQYLSLQICIFIDSTLKKHEQPAKYSCHEKDVLKCRQTNFPCPAQNKIRHFPIFQPRK